MNCTNRIERGRFITFEGGEGSGKSTQFRMLYEYLESKNVPVILTREPGGTGVAERLRRVLVQEDLLPMSELLQVMAARYDHIVRKILPAIESGVTVICDRFIDSTVCYQGMEIEGGMELVYNLHKKLMPPIMPDITFLIDIAPTIAMERVQNRNNSKPHDANNKFDIRGIDFHQKIHNGFRALADKYPKRIKTIKATSLSATDVHAAIKKYYIL